MTERVILDLCGGTGGWSKPYRDAGYRVIVVDVDPAIRPDVLSSVVDYCPPPNVHGVLVAPPCTEFSGSGARWWASKPPELLHGAKELVRACMRIISESHPTWWCLENPVGRLPRMVPELGKWVCTFQPYEYGDPWQKRTCLWGEFTAPTKSPVPLPDDPALANRIAWIGPGPDRARLRSVTPPGFARAFFEANQ